MDRKHKGYPMVKRIVALSLLMVGLVCSGCGGADDNDGASEASMLWYRVSGYGGGGAGVCPSGTYFYISTGKCG